MVQKRYSLEVMDANICLWQRKVWLWSFIYDSSRKCLQYPIFVYYSPEIWNRSEGFAHPIGLSNSLYEMARTIINFTLVEDTLTSVILKKTLSLLLMFCLLIEPISFSFIEMYYSPRAFTAVVPKLFSVCDSQKSHTVVLSAAASHEFPLQQIAK